MFVKCILSRFELIEALSCFAARVPILRSRFSVPLPLSEFLQILPIRIPHLGLRGT